MKRIGTTLLAALAAACASSRGEAIVPEDPTSRQIAALEDGRTTGDGELQTYLQNEDPAIRIRAATALGRMPWPEEGPEVTRALLGALFDDSAEVRAAAAFGLGMLGDPSAADKLVFLALDEHGADPDPIVRARAVEAASKLTRPDLRMRLMDALRDDAQAVRIEAAVGPHRWPREEETAEQVDQRLIDHLGHETDAEVLWPTLFALQRRRATLAIPSFVHYSESPEVLERLFAVKGLARTAPDERSLAPLTQATRDEDWRIACEAVLGLGAFEAGTDPDTLIAASRNASPHVRRCAWEAVTARLDRTEDVARDPGPWADIVATRAPLTDPSTSVRAAFVAAHARFVEKTGTAKLTLAQLEGEISNDRWSMEVKIALADALSVSRDPGAPRMLINMARNADLRLAGAAISALGSHPSPEVREVLHGYLGNRDNGLRLAAVLALRQMPDPSDIEPLATAFRTSRGDIGPEVRFNALINLGAIGGREALPVVMGGLTDERPYVRRVAQEQLAASWPDARATEASLAVPQRAPTDVPWAGRDYPAYRKNPRLVFDTTRGTLEFELFPAEAPVHVFNLLTLASEGSLEGTTFHRVVPDFVIQGADYRGDGNGGTTWRGTDSLRHEIGPRKYVRGSLGMPRNADWDSGGSQIFVTHRPTPHLDGRYTIFGELRRGFDVLDATEVGDRILRVRFP